MDNSAVKRILSVLKSRPNLNSTEIRESIFPNGQDRKCTTSYRKNINSQLSLLFKNGLCIRTIINGLYYYSLNPDYIKPVKVKKVYKRKTVYKRKNTYYCVIGAYLDEQLIATHKIRYNCEEEKYKAKCLKKNSAFVFKSFSDHNELPFMPLSNYTKSLKIEKQKKSSEPKPITYKDAINWFGVTQVSTIEFLLKKEFGITDYRAAKKEHILTIYQNR